MKRFIDVHTGEVMAGQGEVVLTSDTTGPAVVIIAYDAAHKIGALAHALFQGHHAVQHHGRNRLHDAAGAIDEMIADMAVLGAQPEEIEVSLVIGDHVPDKTTGVDHDRGVTETLALLRQRHVKVHDSVLADHVPAHVSLDVSSGAISYS